MDNSEQKKPNAAAKEKGSNVLFTIVIVLIGIMLFLLTDKGGAFLASIGISGSANGNTDSGFTIVDKANEAEAETFAIKPQRVMELFSANWPNSEVYEGYSDAGIAEYNVKSSALSVSVTFVYSEGACSKMTIQYAAAEKPEESGDDLSPIEQYMAGKIISAYDDHVKEVRIMLNALLTALNGGDEQGIDSTLNMLHSAAELAENSSKVNSFESMGAEFKIYISGSGAEKQITINIE